jgi:glycosyltransferase involved in cell wall biosynthesis
MDNERVSVVIPSYNYGRFVPEAVASALAQGYPDVEVIVVDDGSQDDTQERLWPYRHRIRYLYQSNQGLSGARNTGIQAATGSVIALLDADDVWHPHKLALQMAYLRQHPEVGLLGAAAFVDQRESWPAVDLHSGPAAVPVSLEDVVLRARFAPSSVVIRKACLEKVGLFNTALPCVEDREMWIRIGSHYPLARLTAPLVWYRQHATSLSAKARRMEAYELQVLRNAFAKVPALREQRLLWWKTFSMTAYESSYVFGAAGMWLPALGRALASLLMWPWPYRHQDVPSFCARPRRLAVLLLRMLRLRGREAFHAGLTPPPLDALVPAAA